MIISVPNSWNLSQSSLVSSWQSTVVSSSQLHLGLIRWLTGSDRLFFLFRPDLLLLFLLPLLLLLLASSSSSYSSTSCSSSHDKADGDEADAFSASENSSTSTSFSISTSDSSVLHDVVSCFGSTTLFNTGSGHGGKFLITIFPNKTKIQNVGKRLTKVEERNRFAIRRFRWWRFDHQFMMWARPVTTAASNDGGNWEISGFNGSDCRCWRSGRNVLVEADAAGLVFHGSSWQHLFSLIQYDRQILYQYKVLNWHTFLNTRTISEKKNTKFVGTRSREEQARAPCVLESSRRSTDPVGDLARAFLVLKLRAPSTVVSKQNSTPPLFGPLRRRSRFACFSDDRCPIRPSSWARNGRDTARHWHGTEPGSLPRWCTRGRIPRIPSDWFFLLFFPFYF